MCFIELHQYNSKLLVWLIMWCDLCCVTVSNRSFVRLVWATAFCSLQVLSALQRGLTLVKTSDIRWVSLFPSLSHTNKQIQRKRYGRPSEVFNINWCWSSIGFCYHHCLSQASPQVFNTYSKWSRTYYTHTHTGIFNHFRSVPKKREKTKLISSFFLGPINSVDLFSQKEQS